MPRAVVDTSLLFAAAYRGDARHRDGLTILQGIDEGRLPEAVVIDYVLAETLNGLVTHTGAEKANDFLDRIEENSRFHIDRLDGNEFSAAKSLFRQRGGLSLVDASLVSYMQSDGIGYLYAFDDDFDSVDDIYRLDTPTDPYKAD